MPAIVVDWNAYLVRGHLIGKKDMKAQLQDLGDGQTWTVQEVGILWECFYHSRGREIENWQESLSQVWQVVENSMEMKTIFTPDYDPTIEPEACRDFLEGLGFAPELASPRWWSKIIAQGENNPANPSRGGSNATGESPRQHRNLP
jgi:hypothetical protein